MGGKGPKVPQSSINTSVGLQNTEADLLKKYSDLALPNLGTAADYWGQIAQGGAAAQRATAPFAQTISTQAAQTARNIQNTMPAGGEKNLALAQLPIATATNIANLYQGLGPTAASQLQALALGSAGAGTGSAQVAGATGASLGQLAGQQAQAKGQMWGGIGSGLGSLAGGKVGAGGSLLGGGNKGTPAPVNPPSFYSGAFSGPTGIPTTGMTGVLGPGPLPEAPNIFAG